MPSADQSEFFFLESNSYSPLKKLCHINYSSINSAWILYNGIVQFNQVLHPRGIVVFFVVQSLSPITSSLLSPTFQVFHPLSKHQHPALLSVVTGWVGRVHGLGRDAWLAGKIVTGFSHEAADDQHSTPGSSESIAWRITTFAYRNYQVRLSGQPGHLSIVLFN